MPSRPVLMENFPSFCSSYSAPPSSFFKFPSPTTHSNLSSSSFCEKVSHAFFVEKVVSKVRLAIQSSLHSSVRSFNTSNDYYFVYSTPFFAYQCRRRHSLQEGLEKLGTMYQISPLFGHGECIRVVIPTVSFSGGYAKLAESRSYVYMQIFAKLFRA